jgi:Asp-tRNA(Asn)/Glu-tRNA(Gln) amidotransferase A subunit family amidase
MGRTAADLALLDSVMKCGAQAEGEEAGAPAPLGDLSAVKVCVPSLAGFLGDKRKPEVAAGCQAALDLAVAALTKAGATIVSDADDEHFQAFEAKLNNVTSCNYPFQGPKPERRMMDAYLAGHAETTGGLTTDALLAQMEDVYTPLGPMTYNLPAPVEQAALTDAEFAEKHGAAHEAERAELEAAFDAYCEATGVEFLLTPMTNCAPQNRREGAASYDAMVAATLKAKAGGPGGAPDMAALVPAWVALYMPPISNVNLKMLDLRVPSVVLPTTARHDGVFPAGVAAWGKPFSDRRLLAFAMALEAALGAQ